MITRSQTRVKASMVTMTIDCREAGGDDGWELNDLVSQILALEGQGVLVGMFNKQLELKRMFRTRDTDLLPQIDSKVMEHQKLAQQNAKKGERK